MNQDVGAQGQHTSSLHLQNSIGAVAHKLDRGIALEPLRAFESQRRVAPQTGDTVQDEILDPQMREDAIEIQIAIYRHPDQTVVGVVSSDQALAHVNVQRRSRKSPATKGD